MHQKKVKIDSAHSSLSLLLPCVHAEPWRESRISYHRSAPNEKINVKIITDVRTRLYITLHHPSLKTQEDLLETLGIFHVVNRKYTYVSSLPGTHRDAMNGRHPERQR